MQSHSPDLEGKGTSVLRAEGLVRKYGARKVVDGVSFSLGRGECLALFGPNGAGKTTVLRLVAGLVTPSAGQCLIAGVDVKSVHHSRGKVGIISHASMLYSALSARENVEFSARMYGVADPAAAAMAALEIMRVADRAHAPVKLLSRGLQQRVSIARAIVHHPAVLLCDEPYTGLDEAGSTALTAALRSMRGLGTALLLITHNLSEGLELASHTAVMQAGKFVRMDERSHVEADAYVASYKSLTVAHA